MKNKVLDWHNEDISKNRKYMDSSGYYLYVLDEFEKSCGNFTDDISKDKGYLKIKSTTAIHCKNLYFLNYVLDIVHSLGYPMDWGIPYKEYEGWYLFSSKICYNSQMRGIGDVIEAEEFIALHEVKSNKNMDKTITELVATLQDGTKVSITAENGALVVTPCTVIDNSQSDFKDGDVVIFETEKGINRYGRLKSYRYGVIEVYSINALSINEVVSYKTNKIRKCNYDEALRLHNIGLSLGYIFNGKTKHWDSLIKIGDKCIFWEKCREQDAYMAIFTEQNEVEGVDDQLVLYNDSVFDYIQKSNKNK